jgi:pentatricopeptide repeat protein
LQQIDQLIEKETGTRQTHVLNTVIANYLKLNSFSVANKVFQSMLEWKVPMDKGTFYPFIEYCCKTNQFEKVLWFWKLMEDNNVVPDFHIYNPLVEYLCSIDNLEYALKVVQSMVSKNVVPRNSTFSYLLGCIARRGNVDEVHSLLKSMLDMDISPNIHNMKAVLSNLQYQDATNFLQTMEKEYRIPPDEHCLKLAAKKH